MDNYQTNKQINDECILRGICAQSPSLTYMQEIINSYLQELSFYLLKLKEMGITNQKIKENVLEVVSSLVVGLEYSPEQFFKIVARIGEDLSQAKMLYINVCKKDNLKLDLLKSNLKNLKNDISHAINQGQRIFIKKQALRNDEQKQYFDLMSVVVKSICIHIIELKKLDVDDENAYEVLLRLFNIMNSNEISQEELDKTMKEFVELDYSLLIKLNEEREKRYGKITQTEVSCSTRPNKAILISGTNLRELELLLKATQDRGVDVYTHGQMLMAHSFPKLRAYPNLVGHFGGGTENYLFDFAEFPGVILMTKHSFHRVEKLYRSRIYTTDIIAPKGVIIIRDDNFEPLIESALAAKGFTACTVKPSIKLNLDEDKLIQKMEKVAEKIESGEIKHFITIGVSNHTKVQKDYFDIFLKELEEDCFVLSFSYTNHKKNVLFVESDYGFPFLYKSLNLLTKKMTMEELNPIVIFTRCEVHTLSNVINLKYMGVKKIYFNDCPSSFINPSIIESMRKMVNSKKYSNPHQDLKDMISDNS